MKKMHAAILSILTLFLFTPTIEASTIDDVKFFVDTYYYGEIPKNLHTMKSVEEITDALDEYSRYLPAEEYRNYIDAVAEDTPTPNVAIAAVQENAAVASSMLYGNIGYLKISTFSTDLGDQVEAHWTKLKKAGATQLIIDLRYNGGGYVESAEQLLGFFPGVTEAYHLSTREGSKMIKPKKTTTKFPKSPYILVNRYSASASEIVAAAVKDQNAAVIVGETTKGKGTVQAFFEFDDGGALKLTIGEFTGPKGTPVHKVGITPTIKTEPDNELIEIHQRLLGQAFIKQQYKQTAALKNVPVDKTFHIQFSQKMNFTDVQSSNKVELVKLGGVAVPITYQKSNPDTLDVIPSKKLQQGGSYILVIKPGLRNTTGRTVQQGIYVPVTVVHE